MSIWELLYLVAIAIAIYLEHMALAQTWKQYELARWTLGVATVIGLAFILVLAGTLHFHTWLTMFFGFGIAGAITAGLYITEKAKADEKHATKLRSVINDRAAESDSEPRP